MALVAVLALHYAGVGPEWPAWAEHLYELIEVVAAGCCLWRAATQIDVARLVRSSHERFDGAGYPDSLVGESIPLGSRVIAVCDAWDAMVSDRPYRRALSREDALAELERCAGSQFDPAVVEAFKAVLTVPQQRHLRALA